MSDQVSAEWAGIQTNDNFLSPGRTIHLYSLLQQFIYHSRFAGRHEPATRPGLDKAGSEV
jgi:hypothetical protein